MNHRVLGLIGPSGCSEPSLAPAGTHRAERPAPHLGASTQLQGSFGLLVLHHLTAQKSSWCSEGSSYAPGCAWYLLSWPWAPMEFRILRAAASVQPAPWTSEEQTLASSGVCLAESWRIMPWGEKGPKKAGAMKMHLLWKKSRSGNSWVTWIFRSLQALLESTYKCWGSIVIRTKLFVLLCKYSSFFQSYRKCLQLGICF